MPRACFTAGVVWRSLLAHYIAEHLELMAEFKRGLTIILLVDLTIGTRSTMALYSTDKAITDITATFGERVYGDLEILPLEENM